MFKLVAIVTVLLGGAPMPDTPEYVDHTEKFATLAACEAFRDGKDTAQHLAELLAEEIEAHRPADVTVRAECRPA
jgi:hypothetical protein